MVQDLNTLEDRMLEAFGNFSVHVAIQRPKVVNMADSRFDANKRRQLFTKKVVMGNTTQIKEVETMTTVAKTPTTIIPPNP